MGEPGLSTSADLAAANFEAAAAELEQLVRTCSAQDWQTPVPIEQRTVAVMAYHCAVGMPKLSAWLDYVHRGEAVPGSMAEQDEGNALEAAEHAGTTPAEVLAMIHANIAPAAAAIRAMTQPEMSSTVAFGPANGAEMPVEQLVGAGERHIRRHLTHVREALSLA